jgi:hypothetical protein
MQKWNRSINRSEVIAVIAVVEKEENDKILELLCVLRCFKKGWLGVSSVCSYPDTSIC